MQPTAPAGAQRPPRAPHSRLMGGLRLAVAVWLLASSFVALSAPQKAADAQGLPVAVLLPIAGLSFTLGAFLLTGFLSRVCGLVLAGLLVWQMANFGVGLLPVLLALLGAVFLLRGGGAWAMDIYVQKMWDRLWQKSLSSPESS